MGDRIESAQSSGEAPKRHGMTVTVLVPSSLVREAPDKREATRKLGDIARAATVFRTDRLVVYPDRPGEQEATWDGGFVETVLRYATTPPHLRKGKWGSRDELEYVGVLPPLCATSQTGSGSDDSGSLRQGIVTEVGSEGRVRVNCGLQHPISLRAPPEREVTEGERVTIRITSRRPVRAQLADEPLPGPSIERMDLIAALDRDDAGLRVATSRHGEPLTVSHLRSIVATIETDGLTVAFGAPKRGLSAILEDHPDATGPFPPSVEPSSDRSDRFDLWLNAIPDQGSEVVRTEEAIWAVLACLTLKE